MSKHWKVPFISLPLEYDALIQEGLMDDVEGILRGGRFVLGEQVEKFEQEMREYLGCEAVVGVNSGTDALFLALKVLGVGPGDEVITSAHTFAATVAVIKHLGATPILVDVDADTYNIDGIRACEAITARTKVLLPVHLNGRCCNMELIEDLADEFHLHVVEDACQALGSKFKGQKAGTFGMGCFSAHPLKTLSAAGDGGYITLNGRYVDYLGELRSLGNHGTFDKITFNNWGYNSRLDEIQALILRKKLPYLNSFIVHRRWIAEGYERSLRGIKGVRTPIEPSRIGPNFDTYNAYVIRAKNRDGLRDFLALESIETLINWPIPLHQQEGLGLGCRDLPITEQLSREVLNLPIFTQMLDTQVNYVTSRIKEFYATDVS